MDPYDFILEAVREAGALAMRLREEVFETTSKGGDPRDLVTSVDIAVNNFLTEKIAKVFPNDAIYSEESSVAPAAAERLWVIDPIDGTANFSRHIPHFAVCVALLEGGIPLASGVYNPATQEFFSFKKGRGAFLNGKPIHVSAITELSKAHVFLHAGRKPEMQAWGGESYRRLLASASLPPPPAAPAFSYS